MSLDKEDQFILDQPIETNHEKSPGKPRIKYTRNFLLSLSDLDVCRKRPDGLDESLIGEIEEGWSDRQRPSGDYSQSFRRTEYSSSPPMRGEVGTYSRGIHGRWDSRSSGRSDKDSDTQSEWDSDSGRHHGSQPRRSWQGAEHDGLLGKGSFPKPAGFAPGTSSQRFRSNDQYPLNRTTEPYQPPRPYKALPHSRRETDSLNDETFGSSEISSEDRAEEERKRKASFEMLRKEQHKAFQERQKLNPEKQKDAFDITNLLDDSKEEKGILVRDKVADDPVIPTSITNDSKASLLSQIPPSRPLVPPGFTSTVLERNTGTKTSIHSLLSEAGKLEDSSLHAKGNYLFDGTSGNQGEKHFGTAMATNKQKDESTSVDVSAINTNDKALNLASAFDAPNKRIGLDNRVDRPSNLSEIIQDSNNGQVIVLDTEKLVRNKVLVDSGQDHAPTILDKLFTSSMVPDGGNSSGFVEHHDSKADGVLSPQAVKSSKFSYLFLEEEKKTMDDNMSSRGPNDFLEFIQDGEKGQPRLSEVQTANHLSSSRFPFQGRESKSSGQLLNNTYKSAANPPVLTCEDLEQSMLSGINGNDPIFPAPMQSQRNTNIRTEQKKTNVDDHASQHLLSLLKKGAGPKDVVDPQNIDRTISRELRNSEGATSGTALHDTKRADAKNVVNLPNTLTLESLFGPAFMNELQSVGSGVVNVSESHGLPLHAKEPDLVPSAAQTGYNRSSYINDSLAPNQRGQLSDGCAEHLFNFEDRQADSNFSQFKSELRTKHGGLDGSVTSQLAEEDSSLMNEHLRNTMHRESSKANPGAPLNIAEKFAALNYGGLREERPTVGSHEGHSFMRYPHEMREPDLSFHNLNIHPSGQQVHPHWVNNAGQVFPPSNPHPAKYNSQMNFVGAENIIPQDPLNNQFPGHVIRPPFRHHGGSGEFDHPPLHHPMLQQLHLQGAVPPHMLQGFPRGAPPPHSNNQVSGFNPEMNMMQGFPYGHQERNYAGLGIATAPDVNRNHHPDMLQRLIGMNPRVDPRQIPPGAPGQNQGLYGHDLDLGFGYR